MRNHLCGTQGARRHVCACFALLMLVGCGTQPGGEPGIGAVRCGSGERSIDDEERPRCPQSNWGTVIGTVRSENGDLAHGAVLIFDSRDEDGVSPLIAPRTDRQGEYRVTLRPGRYWISAEDGNSTSRRVSIRIAEYGRTSKDLTLRD